MAKFFMCRLDKVNDITAPNRLGRFYRFIFSILPTEKLGRPEQEALTRQTEIKIGIGVLRQSWSGRNSSLAEDQNLIKVLYEYAVRKLIDVLEKGEEIEPEEMFLNWDEEKKICPYDPDKITMVIGKWREIEIQTKIGFI